MAVILDESGNLILDEAGAAITDELGVTGTQYKYVGSVPAIYPQYLDSAKVQTLSASPGGIYFIIPVGGDLSLPMPPDSNWHTAVNGVFMSVLRTADSRPVVQLQWADRPVRSTAGACWHAEYTIGCIPCWFAYDEIRTQIRHAQEAEAA